MVRHKNRFIFLHEQINRQFWTIFALYSLTLFLQLFDFSGLRLRFNNSVQSREEIRQRPSHPSNLRTSSALRDQFLPVCELCNTTLFVNAFLA